MAKLCAVYIRVSTLQQITDSQEHAIDRWREKNDDPDIENYVDKASGKDQNRPEFQRLKKDIEDGKVAKLVFWRLSRLGRRTIDVLQFLNLCVANKVELVSLADNIDLGTAFGRAMVAVMAVFDEMTRDIISENTIAGMAAARERNKDNPNWRIGSPRPRGSFGKRTKNLAPAVMQMRANGESIRNIAKELKLAKKTVEKIVKLEGKIPASKLFAAC